MNEIKDETPLYRNTYEGDVPEATFKSEAWQKCPVCEGEGSRSCYTDTEGNYHVEPCEVCKGKRIISTVTGKPPSDD